MSLKKIFRYSFPIGLLGMLLGIILFLTGFFYELVIPIFEQTMKDGTLFDVIDHLVYFSPLILAVAFLAFLLAGLLYNRMAHLRSEDLVTERMNRRNTEAQKELDRKAEFLKHRYYTNCPNCAGLRRENEQVCSYCGTSLIIPEKR